MGNEAKKKIFLTGVWKCATIEEIEAEKATIVNDAISSIFCAFSQVEYYGTPVSLKSMAQISTPDSSSLLVQPYDNSSLKSIVKAIVSVDLGLNPNNDGDVIRLTIPQLTSDRRKAACGITNRPKETVVDIDVADAENQLAAVEYVEDLYKIYRLAEIFLLPRAARTLDACVSLRVEAESQSDGYRASGRGEGGRVAVTI
ncbi:Ribosome-recycling factor [Thalictrum thalictroides]|uniref:Ribosome-recycling factor, chloroplastic n=1 Tax=Thalictrum thalictroides TaxID=46969 RepID=A0A7J6VBI3_THATH|nr:Ribosome-recycling factor [Thalictrum thalictroides]